MTDPPWLTAKIDQRLKLLEVVTEATHGSHDMIMTPLTEPATDSKLSAEHWERSCDNCGRFTPKGVVGFYTGHTVRLLPRGVRVFIMYGVCSKCIATFDEGEVDHGPTH